MTATVVLVDGSNLLMRCIKAMEYSGLRNGESWQTGPLTAFVGALGRITRQTSPDHLVIAWDHGPCERRTRLYPQYKANRKPGSPEQQERKDTAFGMVKNFLRLARIQQVSAKGFEADDVIAAYWAETYRDTQFDTDPLPYATIIVSGDKDFFQLLDRGTTQLRPDNAGKYDVWDAARVEEVYGVIPREMPEYMALVGDTADGVPGVHGIGPKKALKALQDANWRMSYDNTPMLQEGDNYGLYVMSAALVTLRNTPWHPEVPPLAPFRPLPVEPMNEALDFVIFLRALEMEGILAKFYTNALWS